MDRIEFSLILSLAGTIYLMTTGLAEMAGISGFCTGLCFAAWLSRGNKRRT